MTPFGEKLRLLRQQRSLTQAQMAKAIGVSPAYLSALEHGKRGRPSWHLIQSIIQHLGIIWDEAEELVRLSRVSHPKVTIDTSGLSPLATELANELSIKISKLDDTKLKALLKEIT
ncbi:MAG: helix-turn-helix domain-containing protein [Pseudomonadota bacterium]|jgi:transcriptional regulator with XRE-family HTH domain|nr:helix-turn-helix domain-containing protein [Pseudomonadota bacterium]